MGDQPDADEKAILTALKFKIEENVFLKGFSIAQYGDTSRKPVQATITTVVVYNGCRLNVYVNGLNLYRFSESLVSAKVLITYSGSAFDLPFLRIRFGIDLALPHIDLLYVTKAHGYRGGLKACEKKMGIDRGELSGVQGQDAIRWWNRFKKYGDKDVLGKLIAYNCMDMLSLEFILIRLYNESMSAWPNFKRYPYIPCNRTIGRCLLCFLTIKS